MKIFAMFFTRFIFDYFYTFFRSNKYSYIHRLNEQKHGDVADALTACVKYLSYVYHKDNDALTNLIKQQLFFLLKSPVT